MMRASTVVHRLRLATGLVLFAYLVTHFLNHALGLVSLAVMEAGRLWFARLWDGRLGGVPGIVDLSDHFFKANPVNPEEDRAHAARGRGRSCRHLRDPRRAPAAALHPPRAGARGSRAFACSRRAYFIDAQTMASDAGSTAVLPMGSGFEIALFLLVDLITNRVRGLRQESPEVMRKRHTNLE
jgi:hypothetical protein